jgi:predicted secreted Zn-dependent protease
MLPLKNSLKVPCIGGRPRRSSRLARAAGLAFLILPLVSGAQSGVQWRTNYYSITGATLEELRQSLRASRPWKENSPVDGMTDWRVDWHFSVVSAPSGCRCSSFRTQTTITITMPRWLAPTNAPKAVSEAWNRYLTALWQHEAGHAHFALAAAAELDKNIKELGGRPDCNELKTAINDLGRRVVESYRKRDQDYDQRTRHGALQGAVLPGRIGRGRDADGR